MPEPQLDTKVIAHGKNRHAQSGTAPQFPTRCIAQRTTEIQDKKAGSVTATKTTAGDPCPPWQALSPTMTANTANAAGEQRYRHLFQHAPICIFAIDLTVCPATIAEVNQRAELVYGYPAAALVGLAADQLVPTAALPALRAIVARVQQGETVTTETTNRHRDGTCFPVRVIAAPDPAANGRMIVTVEEIRAKKACRSEAEAIDVERQRMAHEIHDGVAQNLAGLRFKAAVWSNLADLAPPSMLAALAEMQTVLADAITDLRRMVFALRPLDLEQLGCLPALTQLVNDFGEQQQVAAQLDLAEAHDPLPTAYELPLFRIIQEGLNNTGRHARATSMAVRLTVDATAGVTLTLRDNGCGFDPQQLGTGAHSGHFGLRQMRERILDLGGTLDIHSTAGQGTMLCITLPPLISSLT